MRFYYKKDTLMRREHLGVLILMYDGRRYLIKEQYFHLLKNLHGKTLAEVKKITDLDKTSICLLVRSLEAKGIILRGESYKRINLRVIENNFVSRDCLSFPRTVYWECTRNCNYRCVHCYSSSGGKNYSDLPSEVVKKFISELGKKGVEFLSIGGGEPLLYKDLCRVLRYCQNNNVEVEVSTNGSLANGQIITNLKRSGLKFIQVSLDGASEATYNKIRKGGDFQKVLANIKKLSEHFTVTVCTVATRHNIHEIGEIIDLCKKLGAKYFRVLPLMSAGRAQSAVASLQISKRQRKELNAYILKRRGRESAISLQLNENLILPRQKNIQWMPENHYGCSAARSTCAIDSSGNVYPCSYLRTKELICGNIKDQSLGQIWRGSLVMEKMREIDKLVGRCSSCRYLEKCRGGCRAAAYLKDSKLNGSDPLCTIN